MKVNMKTASNILTIDIGGTTSKFAIVDKKGTIVKKFPAIDSKTGHDLKWLFDHVNQFDANYKKIAICIPGFYNPYNKEIYLSGNLKFKNFKVLDECKKYTKKPITILNDANAAALGEYWKLSMKETNLKNVLVYTIGTGIGGGAILNGELYEGSHGFAGEFGHGGCFQRTIACNCGNKDCLEPISSANGIIKAINEFAFDNKSSILYAKLKLKQRALKLEDVVDLITNNNQEIMNVIRKALQPLIAHMSVMIYALDPQAIIIGGGFSHFGENVENLFRTELEKVVAPFLIENIEIKNAQYGNDAAFFGCAYQGFFEKDK